MADPTIIGTRWRDEELDLIVADYFEMLRAELAGQSYVKARHCASLMARIGRTHRSVEFKHQNISAVLDELGLPWIPGYIPKRNYQNALFPAIERYLTLHREVLDHVPARELAEQHIGDDVFVEPPRVSARKEPPGLVRLVKKFDPVERDYRNRQLGKAGEQFVLNVERRRLAAGGRGDLARKVRWVSDEDGDGAGYDILSFDPHGTERLIEVKTTNGPATTPFFLTRNERELAREEPERWRVFRVHEFSGQPRIFLVAPPLESHLHLTPQTWRASPI